MCGGGGGGGIFLLPLKQLLVGVNFIFQKRGHWSTLPIKIMMYVSSPDLRADLQRLLQVAEDIDENVEDVEDGIVDIGDKIEDMADEIEDFGERIQDVETGVQAVDAKVSGLQWDVRTMRNALENELGVVQKELAMMQGEINSTLYTMQGLKLQLATLIQELILTPHSCSELDPGRPSGYYLVNWNRVRVYCDMDRQSCGCGSTPGWMRVANIDMTDSN